MGGSPEYPAVQLPALLRLFLFPPEITIRAGHPPPNISGSSPSRYWHRGSRPAIFQERPPGRKHLRLLPSDLRSSNRYHANQRSRGENHEMTVAESPSVANRKTLRVPMLSPKTVY